MARVQKKDRQLHIRLEEFEKRLFILKVQYEKYFSGLLDIEPLRERDDLRRSLRALMKLPIRNTAQRHRLNTLRARSNSFEMYWKRNLIQIERGTHPKMKFRARVKQAQANSHIGRRRTSGLSDEQEERALGTVYDQYIEARGKCGQSTELSYDAVREVLKKQVRTIKSRYRCNAVQFRVTVEDGKAKVKAVPMR